MQPCYIHIDSNRLEYLEYKSRYPCAGGIVNTSLLFINA